MSNRQLFSSADGRDILEAVTSLARDNCDKITAEIIVDSATEWLQCKNRCDAGEDAQSQIRDLENEIEGYKSQLDDVRAAAG